MAPVATYIKLEHLNKQKINTVLSKIDRIQILDETIKNIKQELRVLWIEYIIHSLFILCFGLYFLIKFYPF